MLAICDPLAALGDPHAFLVFNKIAEYGGRVAQREVQRALGIHKADLSRVLAKLIAAKLLTATTNLDRTKTVVINPEALARSIRQLVAIHDRYRNIRRDSRTGSRHHPRIARRPGREPRIGGSQVESPSSR